MKKEELEIKKAKFTSDQIIIKKRRMDIIIPLDKIPEKYLWDFIRGMMDGDGCITESKSHMYNPYGISFVSANLQCVQ